MISRVGRSAGVLLAILVLPGLLFPGCRRSEKSGGKVTITFWHSFVAATTPALNELLDRFQREYPGIEIKAQYVPTGDALVQKLIAAVQSRTAPDISWIHSDFLDKLVEAGAIRPMDDFIRDTGGLTANEMEDFYPALLRNASWKGTLYALPMEATTLALMVDRELFRKAGLDPDRPPQTWEELREDAAKLTVDRDGDGRFDQFGFYVPVFSSSGPLGIWMNLQWTPFLWQAGGTEIAADQSKVLFNSAAGVQALSLWKQIYDQEHFETYSTAHDVGFISKQLAMMPDGPWNLPKYRAAKDLDWAVTPMPAGPVRRVTMLAGEHLAIFTQSNHPREAWTFLKWVVRPDVQSLFSRLSGYLPVRKSVLQREEYQEFLRKHPDLAVFVGEMKNGESRAAIDNHRIEINQALAEAIEKATLGKMDPKRVLDEAAAKAGALLQGH